MSSGQLLKKKLDDLLGVFKSLEGDYYDLVNSKILKSETFKLIYDDNFNIKSSRFFRTMDYPDLDIFDYRFCPILLFPKESITLIDEEKGQSRVDTVIVKNISSLRESLCFSPPEKQVSHFRDFLIRQGKENLEYMIGTNNFEREVNNLFFEYWNDFDTFRMIEIEMGLDRSSFENVRSLYRKSLSHRQKYRKILREMIKDLDDNSIYISKVNALWKLIEIDFFEQLFKND